MNQLKTSTSRKAGALALIAMAATMPAKADYVQDYSATEIREMLKTGFKWRNARGEVFIFKPNGFFEFRISPKDAKVYLYSVDYGRFTVRPVRSGDLARTGEKFTLELSTSSSLKNRTMTRGKTVIIQHSQMRLIPIKMMSKYTNGGDEYDSDIYASLSGTRYNPSGAPR